MRVVRTKVFKLLLAFCFLGLAFSDYDNVQVPYFKSVRCAHNPNYAYNVTCFAKSWSRKVSTGTFVAGVKVPLTSVMIEIVFQYKYNTIYREVLRMKRIDWCFYMNNLEKARNIPLFYELLKLLDDNAPGFVRPCPWKQIRFVNQTYNTRGLASMWPSGDYKYFVFLTTGTGEGFINVTVVASLNTPLKETFG